MIRKSRKKLLKRTVHQVLAERLLGMKRSHQMISDLQNGRRVLLAMTGVAGEKVNADVRWNRSDPWHIYTNYQPIWHVEMRNPHAWKPKITHLEFLWTALGLLAMPEVSKIPGVRSNRCISIWAPGTTRNLF